MNLRQITRPRRLTASMAAALLSTIAASSAHAVPLDKLTGGAVLTAGNVVFSNFSAPSFVGMGPSAVDVQAIVLMDGTGAQTGASLRFTPVDGKGVNPLIQCATCGGSKEIVMNAIFQANVTDGTHLFRTLAHPLVASSSGASAAVYDFTTSSSVSLGAVAASTPPLSGILVSCTSATPCTGVNVTPISTTLSADSAITYVNQQVQMLVSGRKGQSTGRNELGYFDVELGEVTQRAASPVSITSGGGGSGGGPKVDSIKVSKCYYDVPSGEMLIKASSSDTTAHLYAYRPDGTYQGEVQNGGGSRYGGTVMGWIPYDPHTMTIKSSSGGSITVPTTPFQI